MSQGHAGLGGSEHGAHRVLRSRLGLAVGALGAMLFVALPSGCDDSAEETGTTSSGTERSGPLVVQTVNYPLMYFAERIGGEHVDVQFLAPADGDPAFWKPSDDDILSLQKADLILLNGATYAKWRQYVSLPESRTLDTSSAFQSELIEIEEEATHSHGAEGEHSHAGTAFTTWLDMRLARRHAEAVRDVLIALVPEARADFEANAGELLSDIDALDGELEGVAQSLGAVPLVASHPVYQYLARRYGLAIEAVLWEPETPPDDNAMAELQELLGGHPAGWMIWEGDPAPESVSMLDAIGVKSVVFDPCGNRPDDGDWLSIMRQNAENLRSVAG